MVSAQPITRIWALIKHPFAYWQNENLELVSVAMIPHEDMFMLSHAEHLPASDTKSVMQTAFK